MRSRASLYVTLSDCRQFRRERKKIMIEIKETSRELTKVEKYLLTQSPEMQSMKDIKDGEVINVTAWAIFDDVKEESGEVITILSIMDDDKNSYNTNSATFLRSFKDIVSLFDADDIIPVKKISGTSKGGRTYVNCVLDVDSIK